jgi:gentisate 1,2-dioxygenase
MRPGDLILTPPLCWHGHINESDHRTIWFDAANMPLINTLDASFFEPGRRDDAEFFKVDEGHESGYRHSGEVTRRRLGEVSPAADDTLTVRYVDPLTGGSVMPTLDCYAVRLTPGVSSRRKRTTHNAVCLVVEGEGRSTIGEATFEWSRHDVFTIPHWTWASHQARGGNADLFVVTDRAVYERLELLREELG